MSMSAPVSIFTRIGFLSLIGVFAANLSWGQGPKRLDGDGNPLPVGAIARLGTLNWRGCGDPIAYSPGGRYFVATAGPSRSQVVFLDPERGTRLFVLDSIGTGYHLRFSPDGKRLVCPVPGSYHNPVWDVESRKQLFKFEGSEAAFSDDGARLITVSFYGKGQCRILDSASGKVIEEHPLGGDMSWAELVPGATKIVFYDKASRRVVLFDWSTNVRKDVFACEEGLGATAAPDGKTLALASRDGVRLVDLATGTQRSHWKQRADGLVVFSSDGRRVAWSGYDEERGVAFPWIAEIGSAAPRRAGLPTNNFAPPCFTPDGRALAVLEDGGVPVWRDVQTGKEIRTREGHSGRILEIVPQRDGRHLLSRDLNRWLLWDLETARLVERHSDAETTSVRSSRESQGRWSFAGQEDALKRLAVMNLVDDAGKRVAHGWQRTIFDIVTSPDERYLAMYYSDVPPGFKAPGRVGVWNLATGKPLPYLAARPGTFRFSPDSRLLVTTTIEGTADLWEIATGQKRMSFQGHLGDVSALAFLTAGRMLASGGSDGQVILWDLTGRAGDGKWHNVHHDSARLKELWALLAAADAAQAHLAIWELIADPISAVAFLGQRLEPVPAPDSKLLAHLLRDLDSPTFSIRQRASLELAKWGEVVLPGMRAALKNPNSLEQARRLKPLLDDLERPDLAGERLRGVRAIEVLESIGSNEARAVLAKLAQGFEGARLTQEAKRSLKRIP
jgi:WD40 repeat protein